MLQATYQFPPGFLWGTATAGHQVEGNNPHSDWWHWEMQPDRILHGHLSGAACDWWGGRWAEDFDRARESHQNTHRLSVEWSRIEPEPAIWDEGALEQYRGMLTGLIERGMVPMLTLHHFTTPQWVQDREGWLSEKIVMWFERYVRKVVNSLGDLVNMWVTINEPNVYAYAAFAEGSFPPGRSSLADTAKVAMNLVRAHAAAYHTIHELYPEAAVGLAHHFRGFRPGIRYPRLNKAIARIRHRSFNNAIPEAVMTGRLRFLRWSIAIPEARLTQDYFGLNYYTQEDVQFDPFRPANVLKVGAYEKGADVSPTGFIANRPSGFWEAIRWAIGFRLPVYITENGIEDDHDQIRPRYLAQHVHQLWKAINLNGDIRGYYHWSLVDNFEWERGWTQPFGLWRLNRQTQVRTRRKSAAFYARICRENALSSEAVSEYAPEVFNALFPPKPALDLGVN